ncbi:PAS domain S-box protein [Dactylosporangium vinaceum]|uniref:Sensor-like histidine kinase SenX3 n=1 Tax=Dactylosporangium vinaceum TaxID=53362 RepID=A0ABV5M196_9ACTN|nr:ATP-binding protein [Dactylosporangium vinaceum]UAB95463.1 PAS domain S-box protein [Dactylosporangium vinaceum]
MSRPDRWQRILPFLAVTVLAFAVALLPPAVHPAALIAAVGLTAVLLALVVVVPWSRLPVLLEAGPPLGYFGVVLLLNLGSDGGPAGNGPLALLPVLWLGLYHGRLATAIGVVVMAVVVVAPAALGSQMIRAEWRRGLLLIAMGVIVATAAQSWTRRARTATGELMRATREARRDRDFNQAILDSTGFLVLVVDGDGTVTAFNRRCEELTGRVAADVIGRPYRDLGLSADDGAQLEAALTHALGGSLAVHFPRTAERDWIVPDGRRRIVWSNAAMTGDDGRFTHVICTGIDVTEQRRTERLFADVLRAATEQAIIGVDRAGTVTVFNAGAERLLGYSAAEVVGVTGLQHFHAEPGSLEDVFAPARAGDTEAREGVYRRKDGSWVPVARTVSVIRDESGEVGGYLNVARDITRERRTVEAMRHALDREREATARLRELDKVRADLVATVSHELRTPLTSILGNVEVIVDGDAGPVAAAQARLLAAVERNARRLLALIEDLLMLSRIEAGAVKINARPVQIATVVSGALEALETVRGRRDVELEVDLPSDPLVVFGDRDQLERVVINLLDNALKFTPAGGSARLSADGDGEQVRLTVSDTGMGIPENEIDQIFEQFFRSSRSQEHQSQGTGLGLAITKTIVERHGGRIWATPATGQGTVVTCLLPCRSAVN